jgi:hypothetical protein
MLAFHSVDHSSESSHGTAFIPTHGFIIFSESKRESEFQELKYTNTIF